MTIEGVDYAALTADPGLMIEFKGGIKETVAEDLGIDEDRVEVELTSGSVIATVSISVMPADKAAMNHRMDVARGRIAQKAVTRLQAIPGIDRVTSGPIFMTAEMEGPPPMHLQVLEPDAQAASFIPMLVGAFLLGSCMLLCLGTACKAMLVCICCPSKPPNKDGAASKYAENQDIEWGADCCAGTDSDPISFASMGRLDTVSEQDCGSEVSDPDCESIHAGRRVEAVLAKLLATSGPQGGFKGRRNLWSARRGYTIQFSGDRLVWPNGSMSKMIGISADEVCVEIDGDGHTAKIVGDKLIWDEDVWTYIGEEPLDGFWRTASGSLVQVSGNMISWTSGFRSWLMVKSSDEIAVELHNETFRAKLVGGKLHWDDGDIWNRQHHQSLVLNLDDVRVGATLQVLEDSITVLDACHKAGLGTYKDEKRVALLGRTVQALKKEYYDSTVKCLAPDGGTVWFAVTALTLPQAPAALLRVMSQGGQQVLTGDYMLEDVSSSSGMPIWKHMHADYWLYTSSDGNWCFGDCAAKDALCRGLVVNDQQHWGVMPHQIGSQWHSFDESGASRVLHVVITNVTQRANNELGLQEIGDMLQVLPKEGADVPEDVWKRWARSSQQLAVF